MEAAHAMRSSEAVAGDQLASDGSHMHRDAAS